MGEGWSQHTTCSTRHCGQRYLPRIGHIVPRWNNLHQAFSIHLNVVNPHAGAVSSPFAPGRGRSALLVPLKRVGPLQPPEEAASETVFPRRYVGSATESCEQRGPSPNGSLV